MQPKVYSISEHDIDPHLLDPDALYVLTRLRDAGFTAYLVGGSVRDLLLKRTPKDFDISTSAKPEEIKAIFNRQCLIIGRRFQLAHIRFGHKIIEVATFRSGENESGLIVQDNVWGTPEEDVLRRDFTINGLFYDPATHSVIDYVGGWDDIHQNVLRTIGEPELRFKQDPVRMIRLLKFRARFGFTIEAGAKRALVRCREEILKSSSARMTEEILRMLESGAAAPFFSLLQESGLLSLIYPTFATFLKSVHGKQAILYLAGVDNLFQSSGKGAPDRSLGIACLLFPIYEQELKEKFLDLGKTPHLGEIILLTTATLHKFETGAFMRFPRRLVAIACAVISTQYRLTPLTGKKQQHPRTLRFKEFVPALNLLKIRALIDKSLIATYTSWKTLYRDHTRNTHHSHHHRKVM